MDGVTAYQYQYDLAGRLTQLDNAENITPQVILSMVYDFEGNRKTLTCLCDGQVTKYFWDYSNQWPKAFIKDANGFLLKELRFTYDVESRRVGYDGGTWGK